MSVLHALLAIISPSVCRPHGCKPSHTTNTTPQATLSGNKKAHTKPNTTPQTTSGKKKHSQKGANPNTTPQTTPSGNKKAHTKSGKHKRDKAEDTTSVDTAPDGVMKRLASGDCLKLGIGLLLELQLKFSDTHNMRHDANDMYRMILAMCCGKAPLPRTNIKTISFQTKHGCPASSGCIKKSERWVL